jgi:ribosomal protein S5
VPSSSDGVDRRLTDQEVIEIYFDGEDPRPLGHIKPADWDMLAEAGGAFHDGSSYGATADGEEAESRFNPGADWGRQRPLPGVGMPEHLAAHARLIEDPLLTDDERGNPRGVMGDDVRMIPPALLEDVAAMHDFESADESSGAAEVLNDFESKLSKRDRMTNDRRKQLRKMIDDPMPIPNRPLWPMYASLVQVDQVQKTTSRGMEPSVRTLVLVGNMHGSAGFGIGKHVDGANSAKLALRNAQSDMIHVSTHKGQLYHDVIGKKNNTMVIIRSHPPRGFGQAASLPRAIFQYLGITNAACKIVGSKRRNRYNVVQAVFDAFNNYSSPEERAAARGLRMQWIGEDRHNPNNFYPQYPKGPRHDYARYKRV